MGYAVHEVFLRVDLSTGNIAKQKLSQEIYKKFLGGSTLGSKIVYDLLPNPGSVDAYDPANPLVFAAGLLTGTGAPGCCLYGVNAKSPQTGGIGESESGGHFGAELKFSGYDGIIITGRAEKPVYLYVHDEEAELHDASHLWGKDTHETEEILKKELGDPQIRVACIGQAGENLVRFACITNEKIHVAGKGGMGAVMGSKKLKAIAVRGTKGVKIANPQEFETLCEKWRIMNMAAPSPRTISEYGTAGEIELFDFLGDMPIKNWALGTWEGIEKLTGQYLASIADRIPDTCFGCTLKHRYHVVIREGSYKGEYQGNPEYELCASLGSLCLIDDIGAVVKAAELCDKYGMDGIACGNVIAFAMECYEKGIITKEDTGGIELKWGDPEVLLSMIEKIAKREGFGNILAEDVKIAAEKIGRGSAEFAIHVKGMAPQMHDPRSGVSRGLGDAVATGMDDGNISEWGGPDPELGFMKPLDRFSPIGKAEYVIKRQARWIWLDGIGACNFATMGVPLRLQAQVLSAATGWQPPMSVEDILKIGDRVTNLRRCFGIKSGWTPADDTLPERFLEEPKTSGGAKGITVPLKPMLEEYYKLRKWDPVTGKPLKEVLEELGLEDIAREMWG
ncbi:MAG: aldehyde ferredoxin oxidoreductase family protein [candidate division WOR-3 bacterium]